MAARHRVMWQRAHRGKKLVAATAQHHTLQQAPLASNHARTCCAHTSVCVWGGQCPKARQVKAQEANMVTDRGGACALATRALDKITFALQHCSGCEATCVVGTATNLQQPRRCG